MSSELFNQEIAKLKLKKVEESEVRNICEQASSNPRLNELSGTIERPIAEYVKALAECTPHREMDETSVANFLRATQLLEQAIRDDPEVLDSYEKETGVKREFFLPVSEIAILIGSALVSGTFSEIAKMLVRKIAASRAAKKEDVREALELLLSNPILQHLEGVKEGLTSQAIGDQLRLEPSEVEYYLAKFEQEGWVCRGPSGVWITMKTRAEVIEEYMKSVQ